MTGAGYDFIVNTKCRTVGVYYKDNYDDFPGDVSADTPGRHYAIVVDQDKWYGVDPKDRPKEVYLPKKEFVKSVPIDRKSVV